MKSLYPFLIKRKSMRQYDQNLTMNEQELQAIQTLCKKAIPLDSSIQVQFELVKREQTTAKRGEYCLVLYSEQKADYLLNAGYLLEQIELSLINLNIGTCYYGLAKPKKANTSLSYVIMLSLGKCKPEDFRTSYQECKRKDVHSIWMGDSLLDVAKELSYTPSAINSQPWKLQYQNANIDVFLAPTIMSKIPMMNVSYFNEIDMGILLCHLEILLMHYEYSYKRTIIRNQTMKKGRKIATYQIQ